MSSNTKIIVLKAREIIYTAIFATLGIGLILLMIYMFSDKSDNKDTSDTANPSTEAASSILTPNSSTTNSSNYVVELVPGNYSGALNLGGTILNMDVLVDDQCIISASITDLDDTVNNMYPLLAPTLADINLQLATGISINDITYSSENKYTSILISDCIKQAIGNK